MSHDLSWADTAALEAMRRVQADITCEVDWFSRPNCSLRVLRLSALSVEDGLPIVFVPGWASTPFTWRYFLPALLRLGPVYYLETREKSSASIARKEAFRIDQMAGDIASYALQRLRSNHYALIGASSGANLILESLNDSSIEPACAALLLPHTRMPVPNYVMGLRALPSPLLKPVKAVLVELVKHGLIPRHLSAQREGMLPALDVADLSRLSRSAASWRSYRLDCNSINSIGVPTLVVGATDDPIHDVRAARSICNALPEGSWFDALTFTGAHSSRVAEYVGQWVKTHVVKSRLHDKTQ